MLHNIEKSVFERGAYVGYGLGCVWNIRKRGSVGQFDHWRAITCDDSRTGLLFRSGRTLAEISAAIEARSGYDPIPAEQYAPVTM